VAALAPAGDTESRALDPARLVDVGRVVDPHSRTTRVRWSVDPHPLLRIGAATSVELELGETITGVVVPRSALLDLDGRMIVVVQVEDHEFLDRDVQVAVRAGERALVTEGLQPGERVVDRGAALVHLAAGGGGEVHDAHVH
jgi:hypothetical protein